MSGVVTIAGHGAAAPRLALQMLLPRSTRPELALRRPLVVWDAIGRGAALLDGMRPTDLADRVTWIDLADRRHPVRLFELPPTPSRRVLAAHVVGRLARLSGAQVPPVAAQRLAFAMEQVVGEGTASLASFLATVRASPTLVAPRSPAGDGFRLGPLLDSVARMLSYSGVFGVCEGLNRVDVAGALRRPGIVWIEARVEHFEPLEHLAVATLVEGALAMAVSEYPAQGGRPTMVHLLPRSLRRSGLPGWISKTADRVRHVGVLALPRRRQPKPYPLSWLRSSGTLLLTGAELAATDGAAALRASEDQLVVRHGKRVRTWRRELDRAPGEALTHLLRSASNAKRAPTNLRSASDTAVRLTGGNLQHTDPFGSRTDRSPSSATVWIGRSTSCGRCCRAWGGSIVRWIPRR